MGFFDFFKNNRSSKKKEDLVQEPSFINLSDLNLWVRNKFSSRESDAIRRLTKLSKEVNSRFEDMLVALNALEKASFNGLGRGDKIINMIKDSFVTKAKRELSEVPALKEKKYRNFQEFISKSMEKAGQAVNATHKQGQVLSAYFNKEGRDFFESFRRLESTINDMKNKMDSDYSFLKSIDIISEKRDALIKTNAELRFLKDKMNENTLQIKNLERDIEKETDKLAKLESSLEWKKMEDERKTLNELKKERMAIENDLMNHIGGITRVLKKFEHDTGDENVMKFLKNPLNALLSLDSNIIISLFKKINESAEKERIKFNEREKKHLKTFIDNIPNILEKRKQFANSKKKINKTRDSLLSSPIVREQRHIQARIEQLKKELEGFEEEKNNLNAELKKLNDFRESCSEIIEKEAASQGYNIKLKL